MRVEAWVRTCYQRAGQAPHDAVLARDVEDALALWDNIPEPAMPNLLLNACRQAGRFVAKPAAVAKLWDDAQVSAPQKDPGRDSLAIIDRYDRYTAAGGGKPTREWLDKWAEGVFKQLGARR